MYCIRLRRRRSKRAGLRLRLRRGGEAGGGRSQGVVSVAPHPLVLGHHLDALSV
jgi:hypothetical protein